MLCGAVTSSVSRASAIPAGCARITHGGHSADQERTSFDRIIVTAGSGGGTLTATSQSLTGTTADAGPDLADAASVLLLAALTGHHDAACSSWLENEGRSAETTLAASHNLSLNWSGVSVKRGALHIGIGSTRLTLQNGGASADATLSVSGVSVSGVATPSLMPSSATASFTLPQGELAPLMAATAGKTATLPAVHVTISSLTAQRDTIELSGNGRATLTGETDNTSASGHLEVRDISALIDHARQDGQMKIATALILARMVSHKADGGNTWDTTWEGGVLTVNGVPLPLK
ncbi:hypothetical protein GOB90_03625 [Acetobacter oeni]|nr:hypothetical protein [Acetobacter oeni]